MMIPTGSSPQLEAQPSFDVDSHRWLCSPGRLGRWNDIRALTNKFEFDFRPGPLRYPARQGHELGMDTRPSMCYSLLNDFLCLLSRFFCASTLNVERVSSCFIAERNGQGR